MTIAPKDFIPPDIFKSVVRKNRKAWEDKIQEIKEMSVEELRERQALLFATSVAHADTVAELWVINHRFTQLGIAPRWRKIPQWNVSSHEKSYVEIPGLGMGVTRTGAAHHMRRWIDLYWLRAELGIGHAVENTKYAGLFEQSDHGARNAAYSAELPGVLTSQRPTTWVTLQGMNVPEHVQMGLIGFVTKDNERKLRTLTKWLNGHLAKNLAAQAQRKRYPLTVEQMEQRRVDIECIELAGGSPTHAALFRRWMQGYADHAQRTPAVSVPYMLKRRQKLPEDTPCLRRRVAWRYEPKKNCIQP